MNSDLDLSPPVHSRGEDISWFIDSSIECIRETRFKSCDVFGYCDSIQKVRECGGQINRLLSKHMSHTAAAAPPH